MVDPFSPPPPRPPQSLGSSSKHHRRRRSRRDDFSPPEVPSSPPRAATARSSSSLGREIRDAELFGSESRRTRKKEKATGLGREVRDDELFSTELPAPMSTVGREVQDSKLFTTEIPAMGREVRDSELFGSINTEISQKVQKGSSSGTGSLSCEIYEEPKFARRPKRRRIDYRDTRSALEKDGVTITCRNAKELLERYDAPPWRIGREHPETHRLDSDKRLTEMCLERLRSRVIIGKSKGLEELHEDFIFALISHDSVKPSVLISLEERHPTLAPVLEAGWARVAGIEILPEDVNSWRELHEVKEQREIDRMEQVRGRLRQSYRESTNRGHRQVRQLTGTQPQTPKKRRGRTDPSSIPPPSLLTKLRNEHRRNKRRR